ncbi:MAG TPA: CBS domain-containing protein [Deltaproteobacteria bacterium]|nr:CBS domain-containing protein [Deltaproteobacteria bacterium]HOS26886.1 CBS domain-containing protein [Deltaproteobacteria bacterium]HPL87652.1 CBS domain-containing protein [Deltaproteobacteria bacterium]HRR21659.1 CBS domain-containing protein [Desulfomonilia bacterium]
MITAKDIMTTSLITLSPGIEIVAAAKILMDNHINGAPVVDEKGDLVGILSRDDLITQQKKLPLPSYFVVLDALIPLHSSRQVEKELEKIAATTVEHAMTPDPVSVRPDTPVEDIATIMVEKKIHTIPVLDDEGSLVGIIGKEDILRTILPRPGAD